MRTLASELAPHAHGDAPRIYADANIPSPVVGFMRQKLGWDVFFVLEHDELRRARDIEHYRMARQLARTLITLDHDYEDDDRFPPAESPGVIVFMAPDEQRLRELLVRAVAGWDRRNRAFGQRELAQRDVCNELAERTRLGCRLEGIVRFGHQLGGFEQ